VDRGVLQRRGFSGFARVNKISPLSLGYPLSVFNLNKNSTLKETELTKQNKTKTNRNVLGPT